MDIQIKNIINSFKEDLDTFSTSDSAIMFLVDKVNSLVKKGKYDQGHAILDFVRYNYMRREGQEPSKDLKLKLIKMQLQRCIIFAGQNNKGGAELMISIADNMQKKLTAYSDEINELKRLIGLDNTQQIFQQVIKDEQFDLNNLKLTIRLLTEKSSSTPQSSRATSSEIEEHPMLVFGIKPYASDD